MKIGIIGAGQIGGTLIRQYSKAGHTIKMTNSSGIEKLKKLEEETGAKAVSLTEVVKDIDVLVISIPFIAIPELSKSLAHNISSGTIVIDTTNYYPIRDGRIDEIENGTPESVWVSNHLSQPVIKVYNSILAASLILAGLPEGSPSRIALPVSGDNERSKKIVASLVNDSGFDTLDIGSLQDSWRQQPGSPIYCTDLNLLQLKNNFLNAKRNLLPARRDLALQFILKQKPELWKEWWKDCVANNRVVYETDLSE
ncbi:MAG: NAD(P)-binding domain-containing protein [Chitinophagaceae bacterium]|nr:NAD(P)-binding domain-containing protein [Chitinophagaceae bacterium]